MMLKKVINRCKVCLRHNHTREVNNPALAHHIDTLMDKISVDIKGGLPITPDGYHAILVAVEFLSKYAWAFPIKTKSGDEIASHLMNLFCSFGPPGVLLSDQGKEFLNSTVQNLCKRFRIIKRTTSAYNPRCNGQGERTIQTLSKILIKHAEDNPTDWDKTLDITLMGYRTTVHSSTKFTPFRLMFGREFGAFANFVDREEKDFGESVTNRLVEIKELFDNTHETALAHIGAAQEKQTKTQNDQSNASHDILKEGALVYLKNCKLVKSSFEPKYYGPYKILKRDETSGNYTLSDETDKRIEDTYPRWKLKPVGESRELVNLTLPTINQTLSAVNCGINDDQNKKPSENKNKQGNLYEIIEHIKVGRGMKYKCRYPNSKIKWIKGTDIDQKTLQQYKNDIENREKGIYFSANVKIEVKENYPSFKMIWLLLLTMISWFSIINAETNVIKGKFYYCETDELTRLLNSELECEKHLFGLAMDPLARDLNSFEKHNDKLQNGTIYLISKNRYYIDEIGYQCKMSIKRIILKQNIFLQTTRQVLETVVKLNRFQCLLMVETNMCNNNLMNCTNAGCFYSYWPEEEYFWNRDVTLQWNECSYLKRRVLAETSVSKLFFTPTGSCKPNAFYCNVHDSIIVWANITRQTCLYSIIHVGRGYNIEQRKDINNNISNIVISDRDNLVFELTQKEKICDMVRSFKTTTDLNIVFQDDQWARLYINQIPFATSEETRNLQHDINNIMLAEQDNVKYNIYLNEKAKRRHECQQQQSQLNQIRSLNEEFHKISDGHGNPLIVYASDNLLFIPYCINISEITVVINSTECYKDAQVIIQKNKTMYLTQNNIIRRNSPIIDCSLISYSQLLPNEQYIMTRRGIKTMIFQTKHLIIHDLSSINLLEQKLNYNHHIEIIENIDQTIYRNDNFTNDDTEGKFYVLPNDIKTTSLEHTSIGIISLKLLEDKFLYFNWILKMIKYTVVIIIMMIIIYIVLWLYLKFELPLHTLYNKYVIYNRLRKIKSKMKKKNAEELKLEQLLIHEALPKWVLKDTDILEDGIEHNL